MKKIFLLANLYIAFGLTAPRILFAESGLIFDQAQGTLYGQLNVPTTAAAGLTVSSSAYLAISGGNVGIGTTAPSDKLHVYNGNIIVQQYAPASKTITFQGNGVNESLIESAPGSQWGGTLRFYTSPTGATPQAAVERMRIIESGNVGIGTTAPGAKLDISVGSLGAYQELTLQLINEGAGVGTGNAIQFNTLSGGTNKAAQIRSYVTSGGVGDLMFDTANSNILGNVMTLKGSGNVGIGTTSPSAMLHIRNGAEYIDYDTAAAPPGQLQIRGATNSNQQLLIGYNTTSDYGAIQVIKQGTAPEPLVLNPSGGNVGIGTAAPAYKTVVQGTANTKANITSFDAAGAADAMFVVQDSAVTTKRILLGLVSDGNGAGVIQVANVGTARGDLLLEPNGGNVGIGTTAPGQKLEIVGNVKINGASNGNVADLIMTRSDFSWGIYNETDLRFYSGSGNTDTPSNLRMTLTSGGNVGIGTASPGAKLDILVPNSSVQNLLSFQTNATGDIAQLQYDATASPFPLKLVLGGGRPLGITGGSVGIGTASPGTMLDVRGTEPEVLSTNPNWAKGSLFLHDTGAFDSGTAPTIVFSKERDTSHNTTQIAAISGQGTYPATRLDFFTGGGYSLGATAKMAIDSSGNVGIGTTSPGAKLTISGPADGIGTATEINHHIIRSGNHTATGSNIRVIRLPAAIGTFRVVARIPSGNQYTTEEYRAVNAGWNYPSDYSFTQLASQTRGGGVPGFAVSTTAGGGGSMDIQVTAQSGSLIYWSFDGLIESLAVSEQ